MSTMTSQDSPPTHAAGHTHSLRPYVWVFIALLVLLAGAVAIAFVPTEDYAVRAALTAAAYTIAAVKALLIVLWFMHVKESSRLTWLFAGAAFFFLAILIFLTLNDYRSRPLIRSPYTAPPPPRRPSNPAAMGQMGRNGTRSTPSACPTPTIMNTSRYFKICYDYFSPGEKVGRVPWMAN